MAEPLRWFPDSADPDRVFRMFEGSRFRAEVSAFSHTWECWTQYGGRSKRTLHDTKEAAMEAAEGRVRNG